MQSRSTLKRETTMINLPPYDPPQPSWKRNLAGILDFLFATSVLGVPIYFALGDAPRTITNSAGAVTVWGLSTGPALLLLFLIVAYFVVLARAGGTVFQRLFGMKRAKRPIQHAAVT
jgi:hypothetical protein